MWYPAEGGFVKQQCLIPLEGILPEGPSTLVSLGQLNFAEADEDPSEETAAQTSSEPKMLCVPRSCWLYLQHLGLHLEDRLSSAWHTDCGHIHQQGCKSCPGNKMQTKGDC